MSALLDSYLPQSGELLLVKSSSFTQTSLACQDKNLSLEDFGLPVTISVERYIYVADVSIKRNASYRRPSGDNGRLQELCPYWKGISLKILYHRAVVPEGRFSLGA
jgi:hypothetical protein